MSSTDIQCVYSATANLVNLKKAAVLGFTKKRLLKLIEMLTLHGIKVQHHFEYFKTSYTLPLDIDLVLVSTTNNSHACRGLVAEARKRSLPVVFIPDSKSKAKRILLQHGYKELTANDVLPNIMQASEIMDVIKSASILSPLTLTTLPINHSEKEDMPKQVPKKENSKKEEPDLLVIKDVALSLNITERKIKDLINESAIAYIEQEDKIYVSHQEVKESLEYVPEESDLTKEEEINSLIPIYLPIVAKDFNSFGYEYNRQFSTVHKDLLKNQRRPRLWRKALTATRQILGVSLTVQFDMKKYRCSVDVAKYKQACIDHNLEGIELVESEHTKLIIEPTQNVKHAKDKPQPKDQPQMKEQPQLSTQSEALSMQQLVEEIRKRMIDQKIVRLEILPDSINADMVKTVSLKF